MSIILDSPLGRFRRVQGDDGLFSFLWECPQCQRWGGLSYSQWHGSVSVHCDCGYHETHNYRAALEAAVLQLGTA